MTESSRLSREQIQIIARRAAQEPGDGSNLRWERTVAVATILVGMGLPDPTVEQAARLIRWADAYEQGAVERAADAVATLFAPETSERIS